MSLRSLLTGQGEIDLNGQKISGKFFSRPESPQAHGFQIESDGQFIQGYGQSREEARLNAAAALLKSRSNSETQL